MKLLFVTVLVMTAMCASGQHAGQSGTVRWDSVFGACKWEYKVSQAGENCSLKMKWSCSDHDEVFTCERTDAHRGLESEIKLVVPIRVAGSKDPQLLVTLYRPNWMDYRLYTASFDGIDKVFSFSCRDTNAINWISSNGDLKWFYTYDRFEPPPVSLDLKSPPSSKLELRQEWNYNKDLNQWLPSHKHWISYTSQSIGGHRAILKPSDCEFRFQGER